MLRFSLIIAVFVFFASASFANELSHLPLAEEPSIRIGLATDLRSVTISTADSQLTAISPEESLKYLAVSRITATARAYRPPEVEVFHFEIAGIQTREEAEQIAKDAKEAIGENTTILPELNVNTWRVRIGNSRPTPEEAADFKQTLSEKGFEAQIVTEKVKQPSADALALSQKKSANPVLSATAQTLVQPTASILDPNLREVVVSGADFTANFTSLKPVAFGSTNERAVPVSVNGKKYRGRIEVFVNNRGSLTVVNVVKMEDYLRGVVPNELGFPNLEAQKAQAVAARTYAVRNIGQFASQGFDILPTTRSQVYKGFSSEAAMGTRAVDETRGIVATYQGKPIIAYYTSTCGGRTENGENIFDKESGPYLRGVECSLEGQQHFEPFLVKSSRELPKIEKEAFVEMTRQAAFLAVNNFQIAAPRFSDDWFENAPNENELRSWMSQISVRLGKTFPTQVNSETAKPANFAQLLGTLLYGADYADTMLSASDVNYNLPAAEIEKIPINQRANVAILLRDGWLSLYPDATLRLDKSMSRARILSIILRLAEKRKWFPALQTGTAKQSEFGKLILQSGRTTRTLNLRPDVFLFRQFGDAAFQVKETALLGGEPVLFHTDAAGNVDYLEVRPTTNVTTAEKMSPLAFWNVNLSPGAVQSRLSRFVRGIGNLIDVNVKQRGSSRRAIELEIIGSNGVKTLKGGKIRSALRLKEQLFVLNKRYNANGTVIGYTFTGRGWGHGVGMCQYGAYGMAKMGVKYDRIIKHYYSGVDLTKAY
ncbi:MAG: SpoIID/LytB domain-containing protein [Acidobacteriota bacterium]|nr:SpoIID/LytB domain-containing protein [Acidobacteriota bacterium]